MAIKSIYAYRKAQGKCTGCCKPNDNLPRTLCKFCMKKAIEKSSKHFAKQRERLLKQGIKLRKYNRTKPGKYDEPKDPTS